MGQAADGGRRRESRTATDVLDVAERLVQSRGFNGFSYADVADELDLSKAALHYHFASKAELGEALLLRYAQRFFDALTDIDSEVGGAPGKLHDYVDLYRRVLRDKRMCLCGMLAAEYETLPDRMQQAVVYFLDRNETWVSKVLEQGRMEGSIGFDGKSDALARTIVGSLEGAMLVARPYGDLTWFEATASHILGELAVPTPGDQSSNRARRQPT
jgi:TetR/AcrR family transcriptional regulator, transcriptional repressor for nem operon